jgi:hypothetical protein
MIIRPDKKKKHKLGEDIAVYVDAFNNTTVGINMMFTSDHKLFNQFKFLLKYHLNRGNKSALKKLKLILDENTTVELVEEKTYPGQQPKHKFKITRFEFSEQVKNQINEEYMSCSIKNIYSSDIVK